MRLSHRVTLIHRAVEELLLERGLTVTREVIRTWCIKFSDLVAQGLRTVNPVGIPGGTLTLRPVDIGGVGHWLWRAVDEHGVMLDIVLQNHRETEAARLFIDRLLGESDVPAVIHTDKVWRDVQPFGEPRALPRGARSCRFDRPGAPPWSSRPIAPHGGRNNNSEGADHEPEHRASSTCTPRSLSVTILLAQLVPPATVVNNMLPSRRGGIRFSGRPERQVACLYRIPLAATPTLCHNKIRLSFLHAL